MSSTYILLFVSIQLLTNLDASYLVVKSLSFSNAETYCQQHCSSNLVSIHSSSQYDSTLSLLQSSSINVSWIGLSDQQNEGTFLWTDASTLSYTAFATPPSSNSGTNCVQINTLTQYWQVIDCDTEQAFLCNASCTTSTPNQHVQDDDDDADDNNNNNTLETLQSIMREYIWLMISGLAIVTVACICCFFLCYKRKKQYAKGMEEQQIDKYRAHLQQASASKLSANKRTHSALEQSTAASQASGHAQNNKTTVEMSNNAHTEMDIDNYAISPSDQRYIDSMLQPSHKEQPSTLADFVVDVVDIDATMDDIYGTESRFSTTLSDKEKKKRSKGTGDETNASMNVAYGSTAKVRVPVTEKHDHSKSPRQEMMDAMRASRSPSPKPLNITVTSPAGRSKEYGKVSKMRVPGRREDDDQTVDHVRTASDHGTVTAHKRSNVKVDTV